MMAFFGCKLFKTFLALIRLFKLNDERSAFANF